MGRGHIAPAKHSPFEPLTPILLVPTSLSQPLLPPQPLTFPPLFPSPLRNILPRASVTAPMQCGSRGACRDFAVDPAAGAASEAGGHHAGSSRANSAEKHDHSAAHTPAPAPAPLPHSHGRGSHHGHHSSAPAPSPAPVAAASARNDKRHTLHAAAAAPAAAATVDGAAAAPAAAAGGRREQDGGKKSAASATAPTGSVTVTDAPAGSNEPTTTNASPAGNSAGTAGSNATTTTPSDATSTTNSAATTTNASSSSSSSSPNAGVYVGFSIAILFAFLLGGAAVLFYAYVRSRKQQWELFHRPGSDGKGGLAAGNQHSAAPEGYNSKVMPIDSEGAIATADGNADGRKHFNHPGDGAVAVDVAVDGDVDVGAGDGRGVATGAAGAAGAGVAVIWEKENEDEEAGNGSRVPPGEYHRNSKVAEKEAQNIAKMVPGHKGSRHNPSNEFVAPASDASRFPLYP